MSDNRFKDCETEEGVLLSYSQIYDQNPQTRADALARIAELTPPKDENLRDHAEHILRVHGLLNPTPRTVDAAGRERAIAEARKWWNEPVDAHGRDDDAGCPNLVDRIINALGLPAAEPEPEPEHGVGCGCLPCLTRTGIKLTEPTPAPATPAVELTPDELRSAAAIVEAFRELHTQTCKLNCEAIDAVPSTWPLPIIDAQLPVSVACGEADWVLRIGGDQ